MMGDKAAMHRGAFISGRLRSIYREMRNDDVLIVSFKPCGDVMVKFRRMTPGDGYLTEGEDLLTPDMITSLGLKL